MKKILFYGRINPNDKAEVEDFLKEFIRCLLMSNYQIITREGTSKPESYNYLWLENMVLDIACAYRDSLHLPYESVISFIMDDKNPDSNHNRVKQYISTSNRLNGYQEMLSNCDIVLSLGGAEGVYRFGLFAAGTEKIFIPLSLANGTSKKLAKEFKTILSERYLPDLYPYLLRNEINRTEVAQLVQLLDKCIEIAKNKHKIISEEDFLRFIDENPERIKKIPANYIWKLLKKLPISYWLIAISVIITFIFVSAVNIYQTYFPNLLP